MTTFNYQEIADVAAEILAEMGAPVTLRNYAIGVYVPGVGPGADSYTDSIRNAVLLDFGQSVVNGPGGLIQVGDKRLIMEPGVAPSLEDHIIAADGTDYVIKGINEIKPATIAVAYDLHLRV